MTLDEVIKKSTVKLEPAFLSEAEEILNYVAKKLNARVTYTTSYNRVAELHDEVLFLDQSFFLIKGMMTRMYQGEVQIDCFETEREIIEEEEKITAIKFVLIPDHDELSDYGNKIKLWSDVRKAVGSYYKERNKIWPKMKKCTK